MKRIWVIALVAACTHAHDPGPSNDPDAAEAVCGDGTCNVGETKEACPEDCALCGDGVCSATETPASCKYDCFACGDGECNGTETVASCPGDCSVCGDAMCTGAEDLASCPKDCSVCGDAMCTGDETGTSCPQDCVAALKVQNNSSYSIYYLYVRRCVDTAWGSDQLGSHIISPGASYTLSNVPPDCYYFRAETSGSTTYWQTQAVNLMAGQTYTWNLSN